MINFILKFNMNLKTLPFSYVFENIIKKYDKTTIIIKKYDKTTIINKVKH